MSAAMERLAPAENINENLNIEKKKGFALSHPYVAAAMAALMCLCLEQKHIDAVAEQETVGKSAALVFVRCAPALVLTVLALVWVADRIRKYEPNKLRQSVYICGFLGVEFLLWRFFCIDKAFLYGLPVLPAALLVLDCIKNKRPDGTLSFCTVLSFVAVFGFNVWIYCLCTVAAACFAWFSGLDYSPWKRMVSALSMLAGATAAYYLYFTATSDRVLMLFIAMLVLVISAMLSVSVYGGLSSEQIIFVLFAVGFAVRLCYVLKITAAQNQHDVFSITNTEHPRHNTYIRHLYEEMRLPQTEQNICYGLSQYYHPPLHHALAALWMRVQTAIGLDFYTAYENIQYLTLFYSSAIMVACKKLFEELGLKKAALVAACAIIAFQPTFYLLAGSINNDVLCILFFILSMLYSVRFFKKQSIFNTVALALSIGLGMMTKLNVALVAVGTGCLFIYMLFCKSGGGFAKSFKRLWKRFLLFGAICVSTGLWWTVYTKVKFNVPLGYVPQMAAAPSNPQFIQGKSILQRLFGFGSLKLENIYCNIGKSDIYGQNTGNSFYDYGIFPYSIKSSLFGEYFSKYQLSTLHDAIGYVLIIATFVLALLAVFAMAKYLWRSMQYKRNKTLGENAVAYQFLLVCYGALMVSYMFFCIKFAFTCSMDFRYIVPVLPITAIFAIKLFDDDSIITSEKTRSAMRTIIITATSAFSFASVVFYAICF